VSDLFDDAALARIERQIDEWLLHAKAHNELILAVDRSTDQEIRWYVRMAGEEKEVTTVWLTLGQRTLRFETYVMPAPEEKAQNELILAVDRSTDQEIRWYVRMAGEEKEFTTVWLTLGQRTLRFETYVMPAPEENAQVLYESLLRRNEKLVGAHFSIGQEDAVFLRGEIPLAALNEQELDRLIGTLYSTVEQSFGALIRIGFASRFTD